MTHRTVLLLALLSLTCVAHAQQADLILLNGRIVTADEQGTVQEALAVRDGRIVSVGKSAAVRGLASKDTRIIDLDGRTVIPGLIDSHMHAIRAATSYATEVHWLGTQSLDEALGRLREAARTTKPGDWLIVAGGWTEEQFRERRRPTQAELVAAAPNHPVYVQWMYGWAMLTPLGLKALNIAVEQDLPGGGKFERDAAGKLTGGILGGMVPLFERLPKPSNEQSKEGTRKFFLELNRLGMTGVIDPGGFGMTPQEYEPLFAVWRDKALTVRVAYSYSSQSAGRELAEFQALTALLPMGFGDDMLRFNGIGERVTFALYNNDSPSDAEKQALFAIARWAADHGLGLTIHCQSNGAIGHVLDVFERVNHEVPIAALRWSVAHLNEGTADTFTRMKALGVGWTMQDATYYSGERTLKEKGADALRRMPPIRTAMGLGVSIGAGTDAHRVANYNPFVALRWMLDGKSVGRIALRGPEETPNRMEALRLYTVGSAWFDHSDADRGTLVPGKLADLAVLSADYLSVPLEEIAGLHSLLTLVGGRVVYAEGPYSKLQ